VTRLTRKQNLFALAVQNGATYADAYRQSYSAEHMQPETIHAEASRLAGHHKVSARLEELRLESEALRLLDERQVLAELMKNSVQAREDGNLAASNRALELLGKHLGLWKDQQKADETAGALFAWLSESQ
jgi:hypothetical protein